MLAGFSVLPLSFRLTFYRASNCVRVELLLPISVCLSVYQTRALWHNGLSQAAVEPALC